SFTGIASQLLTEKTEKEPEEVLNAAKMDKQALEEGSSSKKKKVDVSRPTTVVNGTDIYMIVGRYGRTAAAHGGEESNAGDWGLLLVKGNVGSGDSKKRIQWNVKQRLAGAFPEGEPDSLMQLVGGGGSGVKMNDGTLVFPVEGTQKESNKTVSLIIHSKDTASWTLSKGMSADGCSDPSVVEREKDKLMMMTACHDGRRRVYESGDKGESWTEALGTLSRVWSNRKGGEAKSVGSGFTKATIGGDGDDKKRDVMLVTLPVYPEKKRKDNETRT
ncbi:trans-sialidase, putative, partial [Trypanosoma cruzi marinkellei]